MNDLKLLLKVILIIVIISIIIKKSCSNKYIINQNFTQFTRNKKITAIVLNYNRPHNIPKLVKKLKNIKFINEIIISHGKKETTVLIDDPIVVNETEVGNKYFSANQRFVRQHDFSFETICLIINYFCGVNQLNFCISIKL